MENGSDDMQIEDMITLLREDINEGQRKLGLVEEVRAMLREARVKGLIPIRHGAFAPEIDSSGTPPLVNVVSPVDSAKEPPVEPKQVSLSPLRQYSNPLELASIAGVQTMPPDQSPLKSGPVTGTTGSNRVRPDIGLGLVKLIAENPGLRRGDITEHYNASRSPSEGTSYNYVSKLLTVLERKGLIRYVMQNGSKCFYSPETPEHVAA